MYGAARNLPLTPRQRALYEWLREHTLAGGSPPSLDMACAALGVRSRGSLHKHVQALVEQGLVEPLGGRHRGLRLTDPAVAGASPQETGDEPLPLLGYVAAGRPIETVEYAEPIEVPAWLRTQGPSTCYVLEVRGDSMLEDGIFDGDRVVVEQRDHARNGETVVALIDEEAATLKRIEQRPGECILHPANGAHAPQRYHPDQVRIQGVLVAVMRRCMS